MLGFRSGHNVKTVDHLATASVGEVALRSPLCFIYTHCVSEGSSFRVMWCRKRFFAYPQMVDMRKRMLTLELFPNRYRRRFAEAGFFAAVRYRRYLCYCCGLELFDIPDDPWHEHARCNPTCHHVAANTKIGFRQRVRDNAAPPVYPWEGNLRVGWTV
jgi:hypothetical protein